MRGYIAYLPAHVLFWLGHAASKIERFHWAYVPLINASFRVDEWGGRNWVWEK